MLRRGILVSIVRDGVASEIREFVIRRVTIVKLDLILGCKDFAGRCWRGVWGGVHCSYNPTLSSQMVCVAII